MKNKVISALIILVALVCADNASAQFRYGPTVGVNTTSLTFRQDLAKVDRSYGYAAGVQAELMFPGIGFGIDFGLMYEQRGAKIDLGEYKMWHDQGLGNEHLYLHYLVLPVHLRFKYTNLNGFEDTLAPFIYAGPSLGMLVGHSKLDCMSFPFGEFGIDFGLGAEIKRRWQVSVSYNLGFTYALKDKILTNYSAQNRTWAVRATYFF